MKKLLILDSNSIINRAFYGIRALSAADGTPTNAIYGFLNILTKLINEQQPDYLCAAFDLKAPTFRHKMYDGYKAQRKPMPDELAAQMPIAKDILRAMGVTIFEKEGFEADDIIGTVSRICGENDTECFIATGDKDDLQLAGNGTKVILTVTRMGQNETTVYDEDAVRERYHVSPHEFIDVKALMGDPSDNIPGVKGIGEKTAMSLVEKYHSIEYIYDNIDSIDVKGKMLENLKNGRDMAFLSKQLAEIDTSVPMEFDMEQCGFDGGFKSSPELYGILKRLELNSIIKRLALTPSDESEIQPETDIFKDTVCTEINSAKELKAALSSAGDEISLILDFSGESLAAAAFAAGNNAYFTAPSVTGAELSETLKPFLENKEFKKNVCDIKDSLVRLSGITEINGIAFDASVAAYLINPSRKDFSVNALCEDFLGASVPVREEKQLSLLDDEPNEDNKSLALQAAALNALTKKLKEKIKENNQEQLYYEVELPLISVLAHMQINGFMVDKSELESFSAMLSAKIDALTKEIYFLADEEFNINSPKQLGKVLFEDLQLPCKKKTKSGYSTNADVLESLRYQHPIVDMVLNYRTLAKLNSTYCEGLLKVIGDDGRIHSSFNQTETRTGRISSTEPNLQNIPVRTELGREMRKFFCAKDGWTLVDADYSQIELRVLAHISHDKNMIEAFKNNDDIHAITASQVFNMPLDMVTPIMRSRAKAVNFGIVYGIGAFSLAKNIGVSNKEASQYIKNYLAHYSGVDEYMKNVVEKAKQDGYVETMFGRRRYLPELTSGKAMLRKFGERVARNMPIQGTAADIIKIAMIRVNDRLKKEGLQSRLILQIHDELIVEAPIDESLYVAKLLQEEMENAVALDVPLTADAAVGKTWYDAKG